MVSGIKMVECRRYVVKVVTFRQLLGELGFCDHKWGLTVDEQDQSLRVT